MTVHNSKLDNFPDAYARYWPPLRAKCERILGRTAAAEDIAQEALVRLWQRGPPIDESTEPRTILAWLYVTSTRLALDSLRQRRWIVPEPSDELPLVSCSASAFQSAAARGFIEALTQRAQPEELEVALLARVDGLPQQQVAKLLNISERSVRRKLELFDKYCSALREELT